MSTPIVKICGIQQPAIAQGAWEAGADYLGLVFAESPRQISPNTARELVRAVPGAYIGVFRNLTSLDDLARIVEAVGLAGVQCHGQVPPGWVDWAHARGLLAIATDLSEPMADAWLLDNRRPGSGVAWDWQIPSQGGPYWLAGGLGVDNVRALVQRLRPAGVDVSSGVERHRQKDSELIARFIKEAKTWPI